MKADTFVKKIKFDRAGLVPAIIQDVNTHQVLMAAFMNRQALKKTIETGKTHFFSRSRQKLWLKGESSGHTQEVRAILLDCDADSLLIKVTQTTAACHHGYYSCFYRKFNSASRTLEIIGKRIFNPKKVYHK